MNPAHDRPNTVRKINLQIDINLPNNLHWIAETIILLPGTGIPSITDCYASYILFWLAEEKVAIFKLDYEAQNPLEVS